MTQPILTSFVSFVRLQFLLFRPAHIVSPFLDLLLYPKTVC